MSGRHRGAGDHDVAVVGGLAVIGLVIWGILSSTDLELSGFSWLLAMAFCINNFVRPSDEASNRWLAVGTVLMATWNFFAAFARQRRWPPGQLHSLDHTGYGIALVWAAIIGVALVIDIRSGSFGFSFGRRRPPAAEE